jgi:hypothetical protein
MARLPRMPVMMISSTYSDLRTYRKAAEAACSVFRMHPLMQENEPATGRNKVENSMAMVDRADGCVVIVGSRYGDVPEGYDKSLPEMEYERALSRKLKPIIALLRKGATSDAGAATPGSDAARLAAFRRRLQDEVCWREFESKSDLRAELVSALAEHLKESFDVLDDETVGEMRAGSTGLANLYASYVSRWFAERFAELEAAASQEELRTNDPAAHEQVVRALAQAVDKYPGGVYTLDEKGVVLYHSTPLKPTMHIVGFNASEREYFKECSSRLQPVVCNSFRSADRDKDILVMAVPRRNKAGEFVGILDAVTDIVLAPFSNIADRVVADLSAPTEIGGRRLVLLLLDQQSVVLGSNDRKLPGRNLGGHDVIVNLDRSQGATSGAQTDGYGAMRQVSGTPFITVAFWS